MIRVLKLFVNYIIFEMDRLLYCDDQDCDYKGRFRGNAHRTALYPEEQRDHHRPLGQCNTPWEGHPAQSLCRSWGRVRSYTTTRVGDP